ncbi:hypothetical protein [Leptotrichia trevisanii]|uniref:hypothetical protein n=1 Tax=Leptotrichia trevisanii TaxID=109328 RepID=UPI0026EB1DE1|nr:hypothetical protein [Leptotrichia trevisanii]
MNSIILELSAVEDKTIDNTGMYSFEIYKKLSEMLEIEKKEELRVSNIFGEFFNEIIKLEKGKKYRIKVITKSQKNFSDLQKKLFEIAVNKEKIEIGEGVFRLSGIITKNKTWCGEYNLKKEWDNLSLEITNFYEKIKMKIVNPILMNRKSILGFDKILEIILKDVENEVEFEMGKIKESILNSVIVKKEYYREKRVNLLNNEIKKVCLGDIEIVLQGYYGQMLLSFLQYVKYTGLGELKEYGFGEIIITNE